MPRGWQHISAKVRERIATCEEVDCPRFLEGWWEGVAPQPGGGFVQVAKAIGRSNGDAPWVWHEPGTPCPQIHKVWDGSDPFFTLRLPHEQERRVTESEAFGRADGGAKLIEDVRAGKYGVATGVYPGA